MAIVDEAAAALESFEEAFRDRVCGAQRGCACGLEYYNPDNGWTWDEGEIEKLEANTNARCLTYAVETITFEGAVYVIDCECWKERARRIVAWLRTHDEQIAAFLNLERKRRELAAVNAPAVKP